MSDSSYAAARPDGVGRLPCCEHLHLTDAVEEIPEAVEIACFLDPENLDRRWTAAADHLARMPGDPRLIGHTAWALTALNVTGWALVPTVVLAAQGGRPRYDWAAALSCRATGDAGPFELLVDTGQLEWGEPSKDEAPPASSCQTGGADPTAGLVELAETIMAGLRRAGCPGSQTFGALAGALGTLARQGGPHAAGTGLGRRLWQFFAPDDALAPGDPGFRRPVCCGLMPMARTDAACCPDCPRR